MSFWATLPRVAKPVFFAVILAALSLSPFSLRADTPERPVAEAPRSPCVTPRAAVRSYLAALDSGDVGPAGASLCWDLERLNSPETEAPKLVGKLDRLLHARSLMLDPDAAPGQASYQDESGDHRYTPFPGELERIYFVRQGARWVLSANSVEAIPRLFRAEYPLGMSEIFRMVPDWLRLGVAGVELWQIVGVLLLVFVAMLLQKVVVHLLGTYVHRLVSRLPTQWVRQVLAKASPPVGGLVMALVFSIGLPILRFPLFINRVTDIAIRVLAAYSAVWLAYRLIDVLNDFLAAKAAKTETKLDDQLVPLLRKTLKVTVSIVGGIFILQNLNVDVGSLLAGLGLGGLAFALAARDTVANFFGSVMIFVDRPFQVGDWIKIGADVEGTVEEVGFRTTRIRTFHNSLITMPNARVTDSSVDNMGARQYRRYSTTLGLTYDTPPEKMQAFCEGVRAIITALPGMRKDFYFVEFFDYGPHSLNILLYCFMATPDWAGELRVRNHLNLEILRLAADLGVQFAFPTQTLHLHKASKEALEPSSAQPQELAQVIRAFGPGGDRARASGVDLGLSFDPAPQPKPDSED